VIGYNASFSVAKNAGCVVFCSVRERNPWNYLLDVNGKETNPTARLGYGFEWVNADATISIDLNLNDNDTAAFLELLYFT